MIRWNSFSLSTTQFALPECNPEHGYGERAIGGNSLLRKPKKILPTLLCAERQGCRGSLSPAFALLLQHVAITVQFRLRRFRRCLSRASHLATLSHRRHRKRRSMKPFSEASILVVGTVRNCEKSIESDVGRIGAALSSFKNLQWLAVESDSDDATVSVLESLKQNQPGFDYFALGNLRSEIPKRTERLAFLPQQVCRGDTFVR